MSHNKPRIREIYSAIHYQCGFENTPTTITPFPPDFILQFPTPELKNKVLSSRPLHGPDFTLDLKPWTPTYRSLARAISAR
uniref:Uncharacterized protein n=1 Tax=Arundo donax TaxID=35708 RepID=A0A0A9BWD2_ARUDO